MKTLRDGQNFDVDRVREVLQINPAGPNLTQPIMQPLKASNTIAQSRRPTLIRQRPVQHQEVQDYDGSSFTNDNYGLSYLERRNSKDIMSQDSQSLSFGNSQSESAALLPEIDESL